ncbi:MAG: hypothetical protein WAM70_15985 [Pyrinomonadaceae bacterium]
MPRIPFQCTHIADEIEFLEQELGDLQQEQADAPANLAGYYRREIKRLLIELGLRRQRLRACEEEKNPPHLRPDLLADGIETVANHSMKKLFARGIVKNIGIGNAVGPFKIVLSVTEKATFGSSQRSHVQVFEVPPGFIIYGSAAGPSQPGFESNLVLARASGIGAGAAGGVGEIPGAHNSYITEYMSVDLRYIDANPSFQYEVELNVDSEHDVIESDDGNNSYKSTRLFPTPSAVQRGEPFLISSSEASLTDDETEQM